MDAIRRLHRGELLLTHAQVWEMLQLASRQRERGRDAQRALGELTPRELEVLQCLADGLGDKEIAQRLAVRHDTVRTYVSGVRQKLGVESRLQAVVFAVKHGAVRLDPYR